MTTNHEPPIFDPPANPGIPRSLGTVSVRNGVVTFASYPWAATTVPTDGSFDVLLARDVHANMEMRPK